ncbi:MAG: hypothetical protein M3Z22_02475 [Verrucomicrobiota bacterium]|nr:hypothetical protein [Verrucomicrobiota bacterium]
MSDVAAPPVQERGIGCAGRGCFTCLGLALFLTLAFLAGTYWAIHHLRQTYSAAEPITLPAQVHRNTGTAAVVATAPPPDIAEVQKRWEAFQKTSSANAKIVLTAAEINALLNADANTRGKVFVSIENSVGHVRVSFSLGDFFMMNGRYLNGEASVEASPNGDPANVRISNLIFNNQPVPDGVLDRRLFGWSPMRMQINEWLRDEGITSFRIEDNRVIGEKRGAGR